MRTMTITIWEVSLLNRKKVFFILDNCGIWGNYLPRESANRSYRYAYSELILI